MGSYAQHWLRVERRRPSRSSAGVAHSTHESAPEARLPQLTRAAGDIFLQDRARRLSTLVGCNRLVIATGLHRRDAPAHRRNNQDSVEDTRALFLSTMTDSIHLRSGPTLEKYLSAS